MIIKYEKYSKIANNIGFIIDTSILVRKLVLKRKLKAKSRKNERLKRIIVANIDVFPFSIDVIQE